MLNNRKIVSKYYNITFYEYNYTGLELELFNFLYKYNFDIHFATEQPINDNIENFHKYLFRFDKDDSHFVLLSYNEHGSFDLSYHIKNINQLKEQKIEGTRNNVKLSYIEKCVKDYASKKIRKDKLKSLFKKYE
jgi:hypothetical protein